MDLRFSKRYTGVIEAFKPGADVVLCHRGVGPGHGLRFENLEPASIQASDAMHDSDSQEAAWCLRFPHFCETVHCPYNLLTHSPEDTVNSSCFLDGEFLLLPFVERDFMSLLKRLQSREWVSKATKKYVQQLFNTNAPSLADHRGRKLQWA
jgi:hypothetical protein